MNPVSIIIICLLLSAFFSGMEIAFLSANRLRIELDLKQGEFSAKIIKIFTEKPTHFIASMLLGNNIVLVVYGIVMATLLQPFIQRFVSQEYYILALQTVISTLLILVTAEFLPKTIFRLMPNAFLNALCIPVLVFYILMYPITIFVIWLSDIFLKRFVKSNNNGKNNIYVFSKTDLNHLVRNIRFQGKHQLDTEHEIRIFQNALDFSKIKVRDCMVSRTQIIAIEDTSSIDELRQLFIESGFSKILIYNESIDNIIGYVSSKDLFKNPANITSNIIKVPIVPETMNANKLLRLLLQERKSLALVVDEFGGTSGIITTEDIMEEIFGEIEDEYDINELIEKKLPDNGYVFSGKIEIEYLNSKFNLQILESEEYDTLAGFVFHHLGRIPSLNEHFTIKPFKFKVLKIDNKRLDIIYVKQLDE